MFERDEPDRPLRRGWTTGACAAAAAKAAAFRLAGAPAPDPVEIPLPRGGRAAFALAEARTGEGWAAAAVIKDAGDDPDVTHGCLIRARLRAGAAGSGVAFIAGEGVGQVTQPGLPIPPGAPAINPGPRRMIRAALAEATAQAAAPSDLQVEIAIPGGAEIAAKTWNPRLGIVGGLSVLGTTGVVKPYSCSAWIQSIHRGVDVARATGRAHLLAATGSTSEAAARRMLDLPLEATIDMGDFAGAVLKYVRARPTPRLTIAGGFAKLAKLAQGLMDLHSGRGELDMPALSARAADCGASPGFLDGARSGGEALARAQAAGLALGDQVAAAARDQALAVLGGAPVALDVLAFDRTGALVGAAWGGPAR